MVKSTEINEENSSTKNSPKKSRNSELDFGKLIDSTPDSIKKNAGESFSNTLNQCSDSDSDFLVIDMKEDQEDRKISTENGVKIDNEKNPAKRRRVSSSKSDSKESIVDKNESLNSKSPPKKQIRRSSESKKIDQVENELEAMFAGLESEPEEDVKPKVPIEKKPPVKTPKNSIKSESEDTKPEVPIRKKRPVKPIRYLSDSEPEDIQSKVPYRKKQPVKPPKNLSEKSKSASISSNKSTPKSSSASQNSKIKDEKKTPTTSKPKPDSKNKSTSSKKPDRRKSTEAVNNKKKTNVRKDSKVNEDFTEQESLFNKFKGPFARVQGDLSNVRWTNIINNPTDSLDPQQEKDQPKYDLEQVAKVTGFGYTLTTLNKNYNPRATDESWICVFCLKPGHYGGLGDLFGPYFIDSDLFESLNLPKSSPNLIKQQSLKSDLASSFILGGSDQAGAKAKRRQKRKSDALNASSNMTTSPMSPSESPQNKGSGKSSSDQSEVWFHEDCICWMPQIRLIGCQILGLSEAIRVSQRAVCGKCDYRGSTIACSQMRCRETAHFPCAQDMNWYIDEETFIARCDLHLPQ